MEYKVKIPPGLETIDICNPPDDLEFLIRRTFFEFHQGTSKEYILYDKFRYIDCLVRNLRHLSPSAHDRSRLGDLLGDRTKEYWLDGYSMTDILKADDELMMDCYESGIADASLFSEYADASDLDREILKFLAEAIRLVLDYED